MGDLQKNILDISHNKYQYLMSLENVNGVGLGNKFINGINTLEPCIHVLVKNKVNNKQLSSNNIIPRKYMGIKTDVIDIGKVIAFSDEAFPQKFRPVKGGCGVCAVVTKKDGTLGCVVTKKNFFLKEYYMLSNNHVLAGLNEFPLGTPIIQPSINTGGNIKNDIIARLSDFIPIRFIAGYNKPENFLDCAIAKISNPFLISNKLLDIGTIKGVGKPTLGLNVKKVGFISGFSEGTIMTIGATEEVEFRFNRVALFKDQILAQLPLLPGDSGSVVVNDNNEIIGLIFSGTLKGVTLFNDINRVLWALQAKIYTG